MGSSYTDFATVSIRWYQQGVRTELLKDFFREINSVFVTRFQRREIEVFFEATNASNSRTQHKNAAKSAYAACCDENNEKWAEKTGVKTLRTKSTKSRVWLTGDERLKSVNHSYKIDAFILLVIRFRLHIIHEYVYNNCRLRRCLGLDVCARLARERVRGARRFVYRWRNNVWQTNRHMGYCAAE